MPQTSVSTFTDANSYAAALRGGQYEMFGKSSRPFAGKMTRADFPRVSLKQDEVDVPWIVQFGGGCGSGIGFGFLADVGSAPMQINGTDVTSNDVWVIGPGPTVFASEGPTRLRTMALPDTALIARNMTGSEFKALTASFVTRPPTPAMDRLRALHRAAEGLAKANTKELGKPSVVGALEEALVQAVANCLTSDPSSTAKRHFERHRRVITCFRDYLGSRPAEAVHLTEVCAAIAVSERTLRASASTPSASGRSTISGCGACTWRDGRSRRRTPLRRRSRRLRPIMASGNSGASLSNIARCSESPRGIRCMAAVLATGLFSQIPSHWYFDYPYNSAFDLWAAAGLVDSG